MESTGHGGGDAILELERITRTFPGPPRVEVLRDVTMRIDANEMVAIVGPSGAGKTTLLNMLGLLDEPSTGTRRLRGQDTSTMSDRDRTNLRATQIGFIFQSARLLPYLDCVHNVMLPLIHQGSARSARRLRAIDALELVGLGHRLWAHPATLSGGEQQRVAIARSVVHQPPIVLCDEPTGNLDSANTQVVLELLRTLVTTERAIVIVTHEADVRDAADRAVEVIDGHLA